MPRLDDPKEFARVRDIYLEPVFTSDLTNEQLMEQQLRKERLSINQAR